MAKRLEAASELADELDNLSQEEREKLKGTIADLIQVTPNTELAATRFKRLLVKADGPAASALRDMMVDIASEAVKKLIF